MSRRRPTAALLVATTLLAVPAPAQHEPAAQDAPAAAPLAPAALLARLRAPDLDPAAARPLVQQLVSQPVTVRLQGVTALRAAFVARQARHTKACDELAKEITRLVAARAAGKDRKAPDPADPLRVRAAAISRREDLTKETIVQQLDPIVAELEAMLWPARETLLEGAADTAQRCVSLHTERAGLASWYALYAESAAGLELHPDAEKHFAKQPPPPPPLDVASLDDQWTVWTLLAMPLSARDRKALEANETLRAASDPQEHAGTTTLNRLRFLLGLPLLRIDERLARAARDHSGDMALQGFFAHESPVEGKRTPGDRAARFGTSGSAENIANGHDTGAGAIRGWWYSPGHHRNMLGGHARTGLGRSGVLWTQMFGG